MGRRTRKPRSPVPSGGAYARAEARNAAVRATLRPLGPGERPLALRIAIVVAVLGALTYLVPWLAGMDFAGRELTPAGALLPTAILATAAAGMALGRAWGVLGFMALLAFTILSAAGSLLIASNLAGAALALLIVGLSGWLFWKLVRVLGRLQAPEPPR